MTGKQRSGGRQAQRGAVLVIGLIFLALLTLMGIAAYSNATLEERMAGNTRDRMRAFEAAETALRDCEALLAGFGALPGFDGTGGMYEAPPVTERARWESIDWTDAASVRVLAQPLPEVSLQPRCIVESMLILEVPPQGGAVSGPQQRIEQTVYRVTAMGYGSNPVTTAMVQSTFRRQ